MGSPPGVVDARRRVDDGRGGVAFAVGAARRRALDRQRRQRGVVVTARSTQPTPRLRRATRRVDATSAAATHERATSARASTSAAVGGTNPSPDQSAHAGRPTHRGGSSSCTPPNGGTLTGLSGCRPRSSRGIASRSASDLVVGQHVERARCAALPPASRLLPPSSSVVNMPSRRTRGPSPPPRRGRERLRGRRHVTSHAEVDGKCGGSGPGGRRRTATPRPGRVRRSRCGRSGVRVRRRGTP